MTLRPSAAELRRQFADRRGLAGTVDAGNENDEGLFRRIDRERLRDGTERSLDFGCDHAFDLFRRNLRRVAALAERRADTVGGVEAEIGADQDVFDFGNGRGIELALGDKVGDGAAKRRRRALEPAGEALPPITLCLRRRVVHSVRCCRCRRS